MELTTQVDLQPLVDRRGAVRLVSELQALESGLARYGLVGRQQHVELGSLGGDIADGKDDVAEDLVFERQVPRLTVRYPEVRIHRIGVAGGARTGGKTTFQGQHLLRTGDQRGGLCKWRLVDQVRNEASINRAVVEDAVAGANHEAMLQPWPVSETH